VTTQLGKEPTVDELDAAVAMLKLLADRTRLLIVWALLHGEHSVGDLAEHVGVAVPAVSQHLAKLRLAHLVSTRRDGTRIYYAAESDHALRLVTEALFQAEHVTSVNPPHHRTPASRTKAS
jgi:DNA-binding transcriptional ArsR family regulator